MKSFFGTEDEYQNLNVEKKIFLDAVFNFLPEKKLFFSANIYK